VVLGKESEVCSSRLRERSGDGEILSSEHSASKDKRRKEERKTEHEFTQRKKKNRQDAHMTRRDQEEKKRRAVDDRGEVIRAFLAYLPWEGKRVRKRLRGGGEKKSSEVASIKKAASTDKSPKSLSSSDLYE